MDLQLALSALSSVLLVVFGFLLNRVFQEIDGLRKADQQLAREDANLSKVISELRPTLIDKVSFDQHVLREERLMSSLHSAVEENRRLLTDLNLKLVEHLASQRANGV